MYLVLSCGRTCPECYLMSYTLNLLFIVLGGGDCESGGGGSDGEGGGGND